MNKKDNNQATSNQVFTYLEFGSINPRKADKEVYDFRVDQKAYDWLMHARYSNDIFAYQQMSEKLFADDIDGLINLFINEVHHQNDFIFNLNKKIALDITGDSFLELGQTLYGCIDTIEFINKLEKHLFTDFNKVACLKQVEWFGVDISEFFNFMAPKMHQEYQVSTSTSLLDLPDKYDVFFAKGITLLYAIQSARGLFDFVSKAKITVFDYSISLTEQVDSYIGTGKAVRFLSKVEFDKFYQLVRKSGKEIWVRGNSKPDIENNRFYIEGIITNDAYARDFVQKQNDWMRILQRQAPRLFDTLVHDKDPEYSTWSILSDSYKC